MKKLILFTLLIAGLTQSMTAMEEQNIVDAELIKDPALGRDPFKTRETDLTYLREYTQLPPRQTDEDRYQAILEIILGGNASKEKIKNWRKANIDYLEHIHTYYPDDSAFISIIPVLEGQLKMLDLDEQLIDNPQNEWLWDEMEALCDELIANNSHFSNVATLFATLKKAVRDARPQIVNSRILSEDTRELQRQRLLRAEEAWALMNAEETESDAENTNELEEASSKGKDEISEESEEEVVPANQVDIKEAATRASQVNVEEEAAHANQAEIAKELVRIDTATTETASPMADEIVADIPDLPGQDNEEQNRPTYNNAQIRLIPDEEEIEPAHEPRKLDCIEVTKNLVEQQLVKIGKGVRHLLTCQLDEADQEVPFIEPAASKDPQLEALIDRDRMMHDFLHDHARFQTNWSHLPQEVGAAISQRAITPALAMLQKKIEVPYKTLEGNPQAHNAEFSQNGLFLAGPMMSSTSSCFTAKIWNAQTGSCMHILEHPNYYTGSTKLSPNSELLLTLPTRGNPTIWDTKTGVRLFSFEHFTNNLFGNFNQDSTLLVTTGDHIAKIWDMKTRSCLHTLNHAHVNSAIFNPDGTLLATACDSGLAKLWHVESGVCLHTLTGHTKKINEAHFNKAGTRLLTASDGGSAKLWDIETGTCLFTLRHNHPVNSAQFSPDDSLVLTASDDNTAKLWDTETGNCLHTLSGHTKEVKLARFNQDGSLLATVSYDEHTIRLWNVKSATCLTTLSQTWPSRAQFSPNSRLLTTISPVPMFWHENLKIWNLERYFQLIQFLEKDLTLEQAMLINCIYQTAIINKLDWKKKLLRRQHPKFNFNEFPHLMPYYESLPEEIQLALKEYVVLKDGHSAGCSVQ